MNELDLLASTWINLENIMPIGKKKKSKFERATFRIKPVMKF